MSKKLEPKVTFEGSFSSLVGLMAKTPKIKKAPTKKKTEPKVKKKS